MIQKECCEQIGKLMTYIGKRDEEIIKEFKTFLRSDQGEIRKDCLTSVKPFVL